MKAIFKRELRALLGGLRGWGYAAVVLLGAAVSVLFNNMLTGAPKFELNAYYIALSMIPATALAAADSFQAERRQNTERLLYSLPLKNTQIVLGKLFALFVPVLIAMAGLCVFPLMMSLMGPVALGTAYASIAALTVLGLAMMAIGLCVSVCSVHAAVAVIATIAVLALSWAAPYAAEIVSAAGTVTIPMLLAFMLLAFAATYLLSSNTLLGIILAAVVEVPMLLAYLQGTGADLMKTIGGGIKALSLFEGLNLFINGLFDGRVLIAWLAAAVFAAVVTILYVGHRRQGKRRAL